MILVTGASGYVGHHLVHRLVETGKPVRAMVHNPVKAEARLSDILNQIEIIQGDVTKPDTLARAMQDVDIVVHLVAVAIEKDGLNYETVNTQGTINVVDAAKAAGVRRFINMSQNGADASLPYRFLASKGKAQDYVAASGLDWTAFKPSVIWGPGDEFANVQARLIKLTPFIFPVVGDGKALFQPVYVGDVVAAIALSLDDEAAIGQEYELGGLEVLTYKQMVQRVLEALDTSRLLVRVPVPLLRLVVKLMSVALPNPPVTPSLLDLLKVDNVIQRNALTDVFDIKPRPFIPAHLRYMKDFSRLGTIKRFLGRI